MPCYHPLLGISQGINLKTGKQSYAVRAYSDALLAEFPDAVILPCGHCIGCRLERSRQWANRCCLELKYHDSAYFVTLTYDDDHVPISWSEDPLTHESICHLTLSKRHMQLWLKRVRKAFPDDKIRFFLCGEYGDVTLRPHYHAILFGLHLDDLVPKRIDPKGFVYSTSAKLEKTWISEQKCEGSITPLTNQKTWDIFHILWKISHVSAQKVPLVASW